MMQIIAEIEEYRYQLEHLDRIRLSFFTYHRSDTDIAFQMRTLTYNKTVNQNFIGLISEILLVSSFDYR